MTVVHPRSDWTSRKPKRTVPLLPAAVKYIAVHWPGSVGSLDVAKVIQQLRGWQNFHMDDRGWSDIAYNEAVDQNGEVWMLRGPHADGSVKNMGGQVYSILAIYGTKDTPSEAMKRTIKDRVELARKTYKKASLKGHRELRQTDCPGDKIYKWIKDGMPVDIVTPPPPEPVQLTTKIRFMEYNAWDERFGPEFDGRLDKTVANIKAANPDMIAFSEFPEDARNKTRKKLRADEYLVWANDAVTLMWRDSVLEHMDIDEVYTPDFNSYAGAVVAQFRHRKTGQLFVFGSYHLTPDSISSDDAQIKQLKQVVADTRKLKGFRIIGGDGLNDLDWLPGWDDARVSAVNSNTRDRITYKHGKGYITDHIAVDKSNDEEYKIQGYNVLETGFASDHNALITAIVVMATVPA